ncbi:hypothetical protein DWU98_06830 [Dyella monticola]|uniref:Uncharacterized protein n=1 Tax=Dyella monticola TaxID=1927958 RepID=A0A370X3M8_9GAMM|nr:hypothetical protein [Dyella monticola]RDS82851.1 hypothetical protein DWU98_06830 [Dyella monticola]
MRATSLLLGCLLSLGAVAQAVAAGAPATGDVSASTGCTGHGNSDHGSGHETSASNGDGLNISRSTSAVSSSSSSSSTHGSSSTNSTMDDAPAHFGGSDTSPDGASHSSGPSGLSWQSLLPGSIQ